MNKVKNFFGTSMVMVMISGLVLGLTACADQAPLGPSNLVEQSTYAENKLGAQELPAVDIETHLRFGTGYADDPE